MYLFENIHFYANFFIFIISIKNYVFPNTQKFGVCFNTIFFEYIV